MSTSVWEPVHVATLAVLAAVLTAVVGLDLSGLSDSAFGQPSVATGAALAAWDGRGNPEELGEYEEGDILFPATARNGIRAETARWPGGIIPFEVDGDFDAFEMDAIEQAMREYGNRTCVRWLPRNHSDQDYVRFTSTATGCWSSVGKVGGAQDLNLQRPSCLKKIGTVLHEMMHAAGFMHEQTRHDRDQYVDIVWANLKPGREHNFRKASADEVEDFGVTYDYGSVMHYSRTAFSKNKRPTINPKKDGAKDIGQRVGFSPSDLKKLNAMYHCRM